MERDYKNKKKVLTILGISTLTVISSTLAYFTTSTNFKNEFYAGLYQNSIIENFTSPDNWLPGDTVSKEVTVKNTGDVPMALRASYVETWTSSDGTDLDLQDENGNIASIINFNDSWQKASDGYYYYGSKDNLTKLEPNITSTSFISGVTFNGEITGDLKEEVSADGKSVSYTSTGKGYDGATYNLTITIDTIQYNQANTVWN